ncbi:hypothetical protein D3C80_1522480 [compost metagenome]
MAVLFNFHRMRPLLLDRITQAVQRTHARVTAPGEDQLAGTTGTDQLVVDQIRGHAHQGQILLALTNDFMTRRSRDQVREALECNGIAIVDELLHCFVERENFSHGRLLDSLSRLSEMGAFIAQEWLKEYACRWAHTIR